MDNLTLNNILHEYNYNQRLYNENVTRIINLLEQTGQSPRPQSTRNRFFMPSGVGNGARRPRTLQEQILFFLNSASANTSTRNINSPTSEQIQNATENLNYSADLVHTICPISLEAFQLEEPITRIRHCGHIFRQECLQRWFENHNVCPVCRHNITDTTTSTQPETTRFPPLQNITETSAPTSNNILSQLLQNLIDLSGSDYSYEYTSTGNSGNLLYEITIPLFQGGISDIGSAEEGAAAEDDEEDENEGDGEDDVITIGNISVD